MLCHYVVLGVERDASADEIKKVYRKLVLKWHPDKNPENVSECNEQFNLIQQAYDVLVDPQERSWYDRHREQILKGGVDGDYQDNSLNLFPFFSSSCYTKIDDSEQGFYAVYRDVFVKLAEEDREYIDDPEFEIPQFGSSTSSYEEVVAPFYAYWQSYCTQKSYVWLDKYDIRQAPNRRVVRLMEKDNKKIREAARKERNEQVRTLVAFVRKRDKRVKAYREALELKRQEQAKRLEQNRIDQKKEQLKRLSEYKENHWASDEHHARELAEIENALDEEFNAETCQNGQGAENPGESDEAGSSSSDEDESLSCIACDKRFGTEKALLNHQKSKKHKENVAVLKAQMEAEDFEIFAQSLMVGPEQEALDVDCGGAKGSRGKKSKRSKKKQKTAAEIDALDDNNFEESVDDSEVLSTTEPVLDAEDSKNLQDEEETLNGKEKNLDENCSNLSKVSQKSKTSTPGSVVTPGTCNTCGESFESRTKLFAHLKATNHAMLKTQEYASRKKRNR